MQLPIVIHNTSNMPLYFWHPSVVYNPEGFGGHKWWMAQSPYHPAVELRPYRARWELPCIHYSDDGIIWKSIAMNPIDDLSEEQLLEQDLARKPDYQWIYAIIGVILNYLGLLKGWMLFWFIICCLIDLISRSNKGE